MYESDEQRDGDIEELAGGQQADLRDRLLAATTQFTEAVQAMDERAWAGNFSRTPGTDPIPVATSRRCDDARSRSTMPTSARSTRGRTGRTTSWSSSSTSSASTRPRPVRSRRTRRPRPLVGGRWPRRPTVTGTGADLGWWLTAGARAGGSPPTPAHCLGWVHGDEHRRQRALHRRGDAGRPARHPRAGRPGHHQGRRRPGDVQQLLPPALPRDRRAGAHRRGRRAAAADRADRHLRRHPGDHHPPALGPPPCARRGRRGDRCRRRGGCRRRRRDHRADRRGRRRPGASTATPWSSATSASR